MGTLSTNITIIIIFLIVLVLFICIDMASKSNRPKYYNDDNEQYNNSNNYYNDANDKLERRLKIEYWNKLGKIYDNKSNDVLNQAKDMLEQMNELHTSGSFTTNDFHDIDEWYLKLCELRVVLDFPVWIDDDTNPKEYKMPLFIELDIKYIGELLDERKLKSQKWRNND